MMNFLRSRGWGWLSLAITFSLLVRLPFIRLPMISDEGGYAYVGRRWLNGTGSLYHDIWVSRPQGILVVYGIVDFLFGSTVLSFRLVAWAVSAATLIMVWRYARDWAGRGTAVVAAFMFVLISAAPSLEGFTANAEVFMALPSAAAAWILLVEERLGWRTRGLLIGGGLIGIATLLKPSGLVILPVALAFICLEGKSTLRVAFRRSSFVVIGFIAAIVPALVHGWIVGWDAFVFATVAYRMASQSSLTVGPLHHATHLVSLVWHSWWLVLAVLIPLAGRRRAVHGRMWSGLPDGFRHAVVDLVHPKTIARRMRCGGADPGGTLLRLWLLGCLAGIAMGGDWWSHYLIQAAAPAAIGLAVLVRDAMPSFTPVRRLALAAASTVLLLVPYSVIALSAPEYRSVSIFHNTAYPDEAEVAAFVTAHTAPEDHIYVAFNNAAIYYLADRPGIYPYLFNQELAGIPGASNDLIATVSGPGRPEIVIDTGMPSPFTDGGGSFWKAVHQHYRLETRVGNAVIYRAIDTPIRMDGLTFEF